MRHTHPIGRLTLVLGLAALPLGAAGQEPVRYPELDRMHEDAVAVAVTSDSFRKDLAEAVRLHAEVVESRTMDDAMRFSCLSDHAALLHGTGDLAAARRYMVEAAEHAQATGDVYNAAMTWLNVGIIAAQLGDPEGREDAVRRARLLTYSSFLGNDQRTAILERVRERDRSQDTFRAVR